MHSIEHIENTIAEKINEKIDALQQLLNEKQEKNPDKKEEITELTKKITEIINTPASEESILEKLDGVYGEISGETKNETELLDPKTRQEASDIIHAAESGGLPMFISNHMRKTADSLDITIGGKDRPENVIEKMKKRLSGEPIEEITTPPKTHAEDKKESEQKIIDINKQIDGLLKQELKEIEKEEIKSIPQKQPTVSDLLLAKLG